MKLSELFDVKKPLNEFLSTGAIAPFVKRMGFGPSRPVPMYGFRYMDDDEEPKVEISEAGKIDFGKIEAVKETELDNIQQGDSALWNGKPATVKRFSFKYDTHQVDVILNVDGKIETKTLRLQ